MVSPDEGMKRCRLCKRELPLSGFYRSRPHTYAARCKHCHGISIRRCHVCRRLFIGKHGRKACSRLCSDLMRAPTFLLCKHCGQVFGPVDHLKRRFCSTACKYAAASTGRKVIHKTVTKAKNAQSLLRYHVQAGHITRPTACEECGATNIAIEGAHFNYDEPLRVRWLCRSCHRVWDRREPKNATYVVRVADKC